MNPIALLKRKSAAGRFERLVRPHLTLLYRLAYRYTGTREDAEDLLQDLMVKLYGRLDELEQVRDLKPWLMRALYNAFVDGVRRRQRIPQVVDLFESDMNEWGTITGTVDDALVMADSCNNALDTDAGNLVYVFEPLTSGEAPDDVDGTAPDPAATGQVAMDDQAAGAYTYSIPFLPTGSYTVAFTCQGLSEDPETDDDLEFVGTQDVEVLDGQETVADFVAPTP
jgi:RNA polymerase sigma factor (sigma-70 family)